MDLAQAPTYIPQPTYQTHQTVDPMFQLIFYLIYLVALIILFGIPLWKIFVKAGYKGWEAWISGHNIFVMFTMIGKPGWWFFLLFIPFVNIVIIIMLIIGLAKAFGRSTLFGIIMIFFSPICLYILALGKSQYQRTGPTTPSTPQKPQPQQPPTVVQQPSTTPSQ